MPIKQDLSGGYAVRIYTCHGVAHKMKVHLNAFQTSPPFLYIGGTGTSVSVTADLQAFDLALAPCWDNNTSFGPWLVTRQVTPNNFQAVGSVPQLTSSGSSGTTSGSNSLETTFTWRGPNGTFQKLGLFSVGSLQIGKSPLPAAGGCTQVNAYITGSATNIVSKSNNHATVLISQSNKNNNRLYRRYGN